MASHDRTPPEDAPLTGGDEPKSVVVIRRVFDGIANHPGRVAWIVLAALLIVAARQALYRVEIGETAVTRRFGKPLGGTGVPGLHLRIPFGVDRVKKVKTGRIRSIDIPSEAKTFDLLTGDENLIEAHLTVQFFIGKPVRYLFRSEDPGRIVESTARMALMNLVAAQPVDWVLSIGKTKLQEMTLERTRKALASYGIGIIILSVNLNHITPPAEALAAFLDVIDAKAEMVKVQYKAQQRKKHLTSLAQGKASRIVQGARAKAYSRIELAGAAARRFDLLLTEKLASPEQTLITKYREMARRVVGRAKIVVLAPNQGKALKINLLDLAGSAPPKLGRHRASKTEGEREAPAAGKRVKAGPGVFTLPPPDEKRVRDPLPGAGLHKPKTEKKHLKNPLDRPGTAGEHNPDHPGAGPKSGQGKGRPGSMSKGKVSKKSTQREGAHPAGGK